MKKNLFLLACLSFFTFNVNSQVTIGKQVPPDSSSVLQVIAPNFDKGVLVPALTETQRDSIKKPADGLLIYNMSEECFNYWNIADNVWQSLCGGLAKAVYSVACSDISYNGVYVAGSGLNGNNYLSIQVDVSKPGNYSITGTTSNGYGFSTQGVFLNLGLQTVLVPGQGQPKDTSPAPGDKVTISLSGTDSGCTNVMIPVLPPTATYSLSCGTAKFHGVYVKNRPLDTSNTVTFNVNVSDISTGGSWAVTSNTVNGVSFSGSGTFATTGAQSISLQGVGTPSGVDPIVITFTTNSGDGAATCKATLNVAIPPMTVWALDNNNNFNYGIFSHVAPANGYRMAMDLKNFGTQANSTVQFGDGTDTWKIIGTGTNTVASATALRNALASATPPDIVVIAYDFGQTDAATISAIVNYVKNKGVLLMYCENQVLSQSVINGLFGTSVTVSTAGAPGAGARYQFPTFNDPVLNGPFGNLSGMFWGEDASATYYVNTTDANFFSQITTYTSVASTNATSNGKTTMFRANNFNFIWVGDGGFNSSDDPASLTSCPFYVSPTAPYIPLPKNVNYSAAGTIYPAGPVYNSIFTANALAWALNQALINGINPH